MPTRRPFWFALFAASWFALLALALASNTGAQVDTDERYTVERRDSLRYESTDTYSGSDADTLRSRADSDLDGLVDSVEESGFLSDLAASFVGIGPDWILWDGTTPAWSGMSVSASGLQGPVLSGASASLRYDGRLVLTSAPGEAHTLTIEPVAAYTGWAIAVRVPAGWSFGAITGATTTGRTATELMLARTGPPVTVSVSEPSGGALLGLAALIVVLLFVLVIIVVWMRKASQASQRAGGAVPQVSAFAAAAPSAAPANPPAPAAVGYWQAPAPTAWPRAPAAAPAPPYAQPSAAPAAQGFAATPPSASPAPVPPSAPPRPASVMPGPLPGSARSQPPSPPKRPYLIEGLFVIYHDGRLVYQRGAAGAVLDEPELVGSMFTAVSQFIRDSFSKEADLNRMGYGQNTILLDRGRHLFTAAVAYGEPDDSLREALRDFIEKVEYTHAGVVERWDGGAAAFNGVGALAEPVFALTAGLTRQDIAQATTEHTVKMVSEIEYYNGFVRLKVGVINNTDTVVTKVTIDVDYNEDVLKLARIEPSGYRAARAQVLLGVVNPGEKASVAYYFDPQICTTTNLDGVCRYRDARATMHAVTMKTRRAEVVCPIFFTKEHANTAMLKRLVESELTARDSKVFRITRMPMHMTHEHVFALVREVVQRHDVKLVREFAKHNPYQGEAWFYGETKVKGYKVVIRASVFQEANALEFFAAADSTAAITGLLAELQHTLQQLIVERYAELSVEQVLEDELKATLAAQSQGLADAPPGPT